MFIKITKENTIPKQKSASPEKDIDLEKNDIINHIKFEVEKRQKTVLDLTNIAIGQRLTDVIIDWIMDNLNEEQFISLAQYLLSNKSSLNEFEKKCWDSLERAKVLFDPEFAYNYFQNHMFILRDGKLKKTFQLDVPKYSSHMTHIKEQPLSKQTKAYSTIQKQTKQNTERKVVFKIRDDENTSGYICHQTSHLTIGNLRERLSEILLPTSTKASKMQLCYIYDIHMRLSKNDVYQRPQHLSFDKKLI
jgi:hypothetical protein